MENKRVILIVLDSVGVGAQEDSYLYGDEGANTVGHIIEHFPDIEIPNLISLGILESLKLNGFNPPIKDGNVNGVYGIAKESSRGKDTITGHWEIAGLKIDKPFSLFPDGFPDEIIERLKKEAGLKGILGNKKASGTEIIKELGDEHIRTGYPIVYTSADSVLQIAACEDVIPVDELYRICEIARKIADDYFIARVIARPFIKKEDGSFVRTYNRKDFSMDPFGDTILDHIKEKGYPVVGVGKIENIFNGKGITYSYHTEGNIDGMRKTLDAMESFSSGLIFVNLVDFDMLYGHRRDVEGYKKALEEFDNFLPELKKALREKDILIITADHGCDPTYKGTDHTREKVPILVYRKGLDGKVNIGERDTYSDIAQTIGEYFDISVDYGKSFLSYIL